MTIKDILSSLNPLSHTTMSSSIDAEEARFQAEVAAVKAWWQDSRWRHTKRPFTAEQIVSKRGSIKMTYANNEMSKKLWGMVENRFNVRSTIAVFDLPAELTISAERRG